MLVTVFQILNLIDKRASRSLKGCGRKKGFNPLIRLASHIQKYVALTDFYYLFWRGLKGMNLTTRGYKH